MNFSANWISWFIAANHEVRKDRIRAFNREYEGDFFFFHSLNVYYTDIEYVLHEHLIIIYTIFWYVHIVRRTQSYLRSLRSHRRTWFVFWRRPTAHRAMVIRLLKIPSPAMCVPLLYKISHNSSVKILGLRKNVGTGWDRLSPHPVSIFPARNQKNLQSLASQSEIPGSNSGLRRRRNE